MGVQTDAFIDDAKIDELVLRRVSDHAERVETLLHSFDLLSEKLTQLDNPLIADAEMLGGTVGQKTLEFPTPWNPVPTPCPYGIRAARF